MEPFYFQEKEKPQELGDLLDMHDDFQEFKQAEVVAESPLDIRLDVRRTDSHSC